MLINDFFKISERNTVKNGVLIYKIDLNPNHEIFKGHFPNKPVVPGVVSIQIINELLSDHLNLSLFTKNAKSIKFTSMIDPTINPNLSVQITFSETEEKNYKVIAQIFKEETVFLKFNGSFSIL